MICLYTLVAHVAHMAFVMCRGKKITDIAWFIYIMTGFLFLIAAGESLAVCSACCISGICYLMQLYAQRKLVLVHGARYNSCCVPAVDWFAEDWLCKTQQKPTVACTNAQAAWANALPMWALAPIPAVCLCLHFQLLVVY